MRLQGHIFPKGGAAHDAGLQADVRALPDRNGRDNQVTLLPIVRKDRSTAADGDVIAKRN